jgi:Plant transposon protein
MFMVVLSAASFVILDEDDEDEDRNTAAPATTALVKAMPALRRLRKRALFKEQHGSPKRKKPAAFDYERAILCINQDYLGPDPLFGHYFERVFRVSQGIVEKIMQVAATTSDFFTRLQRNKCTGKEGIRPEAKVLIALKQLAFGVSGIAFADYFQMSDTTARKCMKDLCRIIATSTELRDKYLRSPMRADARRLSAMHEAEFGVAGCIGCLDCMHVYWRTCPTAWQGQYEGKEGSPSIVLEAVADYQCRIWHASFGFPGTLNDINIWDQSTLLRSYLDGSFSSMVDFSFQINGKEFQQLWIMVDGIYPELSRFVKNISVPLSESHRKYSKWQESSRKSVERAFGILQRKFMILARPVELYFRHEIKQVVETCIILHNMMVELRLERDQEEHGDYYQILPDAHRRTDNGEAERNATAPRTVAPTARERLSRLQAQWPQEQQRSEMQTAMLRNAIRSHFGNMQEEWTRLYSRTKHFELRDAIVESINKKQK